jgi:2-oxoglutarate dehydrogenase E1 component
MQVANVTTPAQYFHLLRRQIKNEPRKPLVLVTPKSLLRHPQAVSPVAEMTVGRFEPVLDDPAYAGGNRDTVTRLALLSGKLYYDVVAARQSAGSDGVAVARVEQFYPWPKPMIIETIAHYPNLREIVWAQEEPRNMGGWTFVAQRLPGLTQLPLSYIGRAISASPASGSHLRHEAQQHAIVEAILKAK